MVLLPATRQPMVACYSMRYIIYAKDILSMCECLERLEKLETCVIVFFFFFVIMIDSEINSN